MGAPADRDEQRVAGQRFGRAPAGGFQRQFERVRRRLDARQPGAEAESEPLPAQEFLELAGDLGIHRGRDAVEILHHRDAGTQAPPHRTQFQADIARADHDQALGHAGQGERPGRGQDARLVDLDAGQGGQAPSRWR